MAKSNKSNDFAEIISLDNDDKLKAYRCCSCKDVAFRHCFANCGHLFCVDCYLKHHMQPCPVCDIRIETSTQDTNFERTLIECKFKVNGCQQMVELRNFQEHASACNFAPKRLLPKLYKEDPVAEALKQLTDDVLRIKDLQETILKKQDDDEETTKIIQKEIKQLKDKLIKIDKAGETLLDTNRKIKKSHDAILKKFTENEHLNKEEIKVLRTEIMQLKKSLKESVKESKKLQENNNREIRGQHAFTLKKLTEDEIHNKVATELLRTEIMQFKDNLKSNETAVKVQIEKNNEEISESLRQDISTHITILKKAIQEIQQELKSQLEEIQIEHQEIKNRQSVETLQGRNLEVLDTELGELQYRHQDEYNNGKPIVFIWKVSKIQEKLRDFMQNEEFAYRSEEYFSTPNGLKFRPALCGQTPWDCLRVDLDFTKDINTADTNYSTPYLHTRKYILLDQSEAVGLENVEISNRPLFKMNSIEDMILPTFYCTQVLPISLLKDGSKWINNDQILIKIILEPIAYLWKQIVSNDGVLLWRITNYSKKKQDEIDGVKWNLTSKPFKTSHSGYTMYVELYLNGHVDTRGNFISIFVYFVLGEYDECLALPFHGKVKFCLLDQSNSDRKRNIIKEKEFKFSAKSEFHWGSTKFVSHFTAEDPKYLRNDSLSIQTTVTIL